MQFREPKGIYQQIADHICSRILQSELTVDERIPSVRELATDLGVNPNTVAKSYQTLLDRKIIINQRGRGYFVSHDALEKILAETKAEFINTELPRIFEVMEILNIEIDQLENYRNKNKEN